MGATRGVLVAACGLTLALAAPAAAGVVQYGLDANGNGFKRELSFTDTLSQPNDIAGIGLERYGEVVRLTDQAATLLRPTIGGFGCISNLRTATCVSPRPPGPDSDPLDLGPEVGRVVSYLERGGWCDEHSCWPDTDPWLEINLDLGAGNDTVRPIPSLTWMAVRIVDGPGDDSVVAGPAAAHAVASPGSDRYDLGRENFGEVDYSGRTEPVFLSIDGIANDGAAGEGDNILHASLLSGGQGDDVIVTPDWAMGHAGNDTLSVSQSTPSHALLEGGAGADQITGGAGDDTLAPGRGDGAVDVIVCGPGIDRVGHAEPHDIVAADCENVS